MKKALLIISFLAFLIGNAQNPAPFKNGLKTPFIDYTSVTTTERDAMVILVGRFRKIYNTTTAQFEYWDGTTWLTSTGGATPSIFEKELINAENNINVGFNLLATTVVFYNGKAIPNTLWSGEGTQILNLSLDTKIYDNLTVKN